MSENSSQEFIYKISSMQFFIMSAFPIAISFYMTSKASDNVEGLRIRFITLSQSEATTFYWAMATLFGVIAILAIIYTFYNLRKPKIIELHATHANLPKPSIFGGQISITYESINEINRRKLNSTQEMIEINSAHNKVRLISTYFIGVIGYEEFISSLKTKVSNKKGMQI
jgi:hypothetical protein